MFWGRRQLFQMLGAGFLGSFGRGRGSERQAQVRRKRRAQGVPEPTVESYDVVVVGGGIAGVSAAIAAARNGARVALVHERSMLGGNSSSEVKLFPENSSAHHVWTKEHGLLEEFQTEERVRNHYPYREGTMNCHWDLVLYEWVIREPNITLHLNTHMHRVLMKDDATIDAVYCIQLGSEKTFEFEARVFVDATGDGVLAHRAGAECRWGREAHREYGEALAPAEPDDTQLMGSTLFFRAQDTGSPVPFKRPYWAEEFPTEDLFVGRSHSQIEGGYWWIEVGAPLHPIHDNNAIIHEGMRQLLGVWDHIKNKGEHGAANYGLEFVGTWPYKRECRRIVGDHVLTQEHLQDPQLLADSVAYGVWFIDIHKPGGILLKGKAPLSHAKEDANWDAMSTRCYGIPLRSLYSRNIENLMMAGRPISCSYVAFSSTRVLATGSIVGQAVGIAASLCAKYDASPRVVATKYARECQQLVLRQDGHIPGVVNEDAADLARSARVTASSEVALSFPDASTEQECATPLAQLFPVSANRIDRIELLLASSLSHDVEMTLGLRTAAHVWDFRAETDIAVARATVRAGSDGWVTFSFEKEVEAERLYYVHLNATPGVRWKMSAETDEDVAVRCPVGVTGAGLPDTRFWRPFTNSRSFCMRLTPESAPYAAQNVVRGTNRPDQWTNLWQSAPEVGLPATLELQWARPVRFNCVQLTFDTNANRMVRLPLFRYPECVRDYVIEAWTGTGWLTLHAEEGNYVRRREHRFDAVTTERLRLTVLATNGVPNARVYEVRVYDEPTA